MSEDASDKPIKEPRDKVDKKFVEHCIYKVPGENLIYNVKVRKRINKKQYIKFKRSIRGIDRARKVRNEFINELEILSQEILEGNLLWPKAMEKYFAFRKTQVAASTFKNQLIEVTAHTKTWNEMRLRDFTKSFVEKELRKSLNDHEKTTVKDVLKHIRAVFEFFVGNGDAEHPIIHNPCVKIQPWGRINDVGSAPLPKMTVEQIDRLLDYTEEHYPDYHVIFATAYFSGLRSGELWQLTWDDIAEDFNSLKVKQSYCFVSQKPKNPKNGQARTVAINHDLKALLKKLKLKSESNFILPHLPIWKDGKIATILKKIQGELEISPTTFHSLRASHITHLLLAGVPSIAVMASVGHNSFSTTQRYVREIEKEKSVQNITEVLNRKKPNKASVVEFRKNKKA